MRFQCLRQAECHHRHNISRNAGNVVDATISLSSWRTNRSPRCLPRSTLSPTSASHPRARYPLMAAVCLSDNNNFAPSLTMSRPYQDSARSLTAPADQAIHHFDANCTQNRRNRPSPEQVIRHLSATHLPLSGLFERLCLGTARSARQEAHPL
jgi:hypothetical protein